MYFHLPLNSIGPTPNILSLNIISKNFNCWIHKLSFLKILQIISYINMYYNNQSYYSLFSSDYYTYSSVLSSFSYINALYSSKTSCWTSLLILFSSNPIKTYISEISLLRFSFSVPRLSARFPYYSTLLSSSNSFSFITCRLTLWN